MHFTTFSRYLPNERTASHLFFRLFFQVLDLFRFKSYNTDQIKTCVWTQSFKKLDSIFASWTNHQTPPQSWELILSYAPIMHVLGKEISLEKSLPMIMPGNSSSLEGWPHAEQVHSFPGDDQRSFYNLLPGSRDCLESLQLLNSYRLMQTHSDGLNKVNCSHSLFVSCSVPWFAISIAPKTTVACLIWITTVCLKLCFPLVTLICLKWTTPGLSHRALCMAGFHSFQVETKSFSLQKVKVAAW